MAASIKEWLEADGLGGYASGTDTLLRTRRYHGLLVTAALPPTQRVSLVSGVDVFAETPHGTFALTTNQYAGDVFFPDGRDRIVDFSIDPWPRWTFRLPDGTEIVHELVVPKGLPIVSLGWRLAAPAKSRVTLRVRPFLSCRDHHHLQQENGAFRFDLVVRDGNLVFHPYDSLPEIVVSSNGEYRHQPTWYSHFCYEAERERGLDHSEDLASPGELKFALDRGEAVLAFGAVSANLPSVSFDVSATKLRARICENERARRSSFTSEAARAADAYIVDGQRGKTIIAGYPWFTDWGRDTFIALRGLCLATGRVDDATEILSAWASHVSKGMLPNQFPDQSGSAAYNSVDAALWYVQAVAATIAARDETLSGSEREALEDTVSAIIDGYSSGTRHGIRVDDDGLLCAGEFGVALTWMDAKAGDWVVTPRIGKPVEVQALWLNALSFAASFQPRYRDLLERGLASFAARFWNEANGCLYDVVDVDHRPGTVDPKVRPNQLFAAGALPLTLIDETRARRVVDRVEAELYTPRGLRTLAVHEPGYAGAYRGGVRERDGAYHQGTVWPWLIGPFVEAWIRVRGQTAEAREEAEERFFTPLWEHALQNGGHVAEIAEGDSPHAFCGAPFQAWSVAELLRLRSTVLAAPEPRRTALARGKSTPRARRSSTHGR